MEDRAIMELLRNGDKAGERELYDKYFRPLLHCVSYYEIGKVENLLEPSDIVQDVISDFISRNSYKNIKNDDALRAYLFRSTRNRCLNKIEKEKREKKKWDEFAYNHDKSQDAVLPAEDCRDYFQECMDKLRAAKPRCYNVLYELYFKDKTIGEVADEMDITISTVNNHRTNGLIFLRKHLSSIK